MDQKPEINIFQGSVATVCGCSRYVNNCCVANYFSILFAAYYRNRLTFAVTTVKTKRQTFLEHRVEMFVAFDYKALLCIISALSNRNEPLAFYSGYDLCHPN